QGADLGDVPGALAERGSLRLDLEGAGPLVLDLEPSQHFVFEGPTRVTAPDLGATLEARRLTGDLGADGRFHDLVAEERVEVRHEDLRLASPWVQLGFFQDAEDRAAAHLISRGETTIDGTLSDGRRLEMRAGEGLTA